MKQIFTGFFSAVLLSVSIFSVCQSAPQEKEAGHSARFPASRTIMPGEVWLSWETPIRQWFVKGFMAGYEVGYHEGCKDAASDAKTTQSDKSQDADRSCPNEEVFNNKAGVYERQMTEFYVKYPQDRDLPLPTLARMLVSRQPKTLQQVHDWVSSLGQ
jgi:hypothetical protein